MQDEGSPLTQALGGVPSSTSGNPTPHQSQVGGNQDGAGSTPAATQDAAVSVGQDTGEAAAYRVQGACVRVCLCGVVQRVKPTRLRCKARHHATCVHIGGSACRWQAYLYFGPPCNLRFVSCCAGGPAAAAALHGMLPPAANGAEAADVAGQTQDLFPATMAFPLFGTAAVNRSTPAFIATCGFRAPAVPVTAFGAAAPAAATPATAAQGGTSAPPSTAAAQLQQSAGHVSAAAAAMQAQFQAQLEEAAGQQQQEVEEEDEEAGGEDGMADDAEDGQQQVRLMHRSLGGQRPGTVCAATTHRALTTQSFDNTHRFCADRDAVPSSAAAAARFCCGVDCSAQGFVS